MLNILITFLFFVLFIICLFMVLVILMQRPNTNAGMGSAFGGGVAESAFGTETTNILTKATKWSATAFFIVCLGLYLLHIQRHEDQLSQQEENLLPTVEEQTVPGPQDGVMTPDVSTAPEDSESEPVPTGGN